MQFSGLTFTYQKRLTFDPTCTTF